MIPEGTLLAGSSTRVEDTDNGTLVSSWDDCEIVVPVTVERAEVANLLIEVETWFAAGCRECQHDSNTGFIFRTSTDARLLLKSGEFWEAAALKPGMRLRSLGCKCGYEEVKEVRQLELETPVWFYHVTDGGRPFGVTDGERVVFVEGRA